MDAPAASRRSGSLDRMTVLLLGAHVLVWLAVLAFHPSDALSDDVARFVQVASANGMPYRDVPVEYMPLETALIRLVLDAPLNDAAVRVAISMVGDVLAFLLVRRSRATSRAGGTWPSRSRSRSSCSSGSTWWRWCWS